MEFPVHIAFCVNDKYLQYVAVTIQSIVDSHQDTPVTVHILSDNIPPRLKNSLQAEFSAAAHLSIVFYDVDDSALSGLSAWSKYTWYRILLPTVLPPEVHRVLYLDADTLVCENLSELFATDLSDKAIAAVLDPLAVDPDTYSRCRYPARLQYVCAGVMLINLDFWRKNWLQRDMLEWAHMFPDIKFHDQDCINYICRNSKLVLPFRFGVIDSLYLVDEFLSDRDLVEQLSEAVSHPAIIHYAGKAPWFRDAAVHPFADRWFDTNRKLHRPARRTYRSKGLTKLKIIIFDILHPKHVRRVLTVSDIKQRLINAHITNHRNS